MSLCQKTAFELLKEIGFVRNAGTPEELKAAKILQAHAQNAGAVATIVPFEIAEGNVFTAKFEITEPYQKEYKVTGYKCCENCEDLEAEFLYVENALDANLTNAKGKIVLVNGYLRLPAFRKILDAGAVAIVTFAGSMLNTREENDLLTRKLRDTMLAFGNMPAVHMDINDAFEIVKNKASKAKITVKGENITLTSHNVEVTIEGSKFPEQIVSFGAHYDSTELSCGVFDNGAGSVINMEIMKYFLENQPKRTVKFLWYGSEEIGLCGSKAFVASLSEEELKKHVLMVNVDVGAPVLGFNGCMVTASKELTAHCDKFMKSKGYAVEVQQKIYSSDCIPFADKDIPAINFVRGGADGSTFIHSSHDVMDFLSEDGLGALIPPTFEFSESLINSEVFPEPRSIPQEIRDDVDKYLFKKELEEAKNK
ncbi:MAG: M20/M25/M40 family metallo-hydrolase [Clostridia bacterium]